MRDSSIFGLLGILAVIAIIMFLVTPHPPGSTSEKIRQTVREEIQVTSDRLNNAWDAAKHDAERQGR